MAYTNEQKLQALRRELKFRRRVYVRRIEEGTMTPEFAKEQIDIFEAIALDYERMCEGERLL
jgi:hypothetical protein